MNPVKTQKDLPVGAWTIYRARCRLVFAQVVLADGEVCQEIGGTPGELDVVYHCVGSDLRVKGIAPKALLKLALKL